MLMAPVNHKQGRGCPVLAASVPCVLCLQVQDLSYLVRAMGEDPYLARYRKLSEGLCEVKCILAISEVCCVAQAVISEVHVCNWALLGSLTYS